MILESVDKKIKEILEIKKYNYENEILKQNKNYMGYY